MTRALKHAVLQQQQMIHVDKALQILDQETPPLVVDRDKLKVRDTVHVCVCWLILHNIIITPCQIGFLLLDSDTPESLEK